MYICMHADLMEEYSANIIKTKDIITNKGDIVYFLLSTKFCYL